MGASTDSSNGASSTQLLSITASTSPSARSRSRSQDHPPLLDPIASHSTANGSFLDLNELGYSSAPRREINLNHLEDADQSNGGGSVTHTDQPNGNFTFPPSSNPSKSSSSSRRKPSPIRRPLSNHHRLTDSFESCATAKPPLTAREGTFAAAGQLGEPKDGQDVGRLEVEEYRFPPSGNVPPPKSGFTSAASTSSTSLLNLPPSTYHMTAWPSSLAVPVSTHSSPPPTSMITPSSMGLNLPRRESKNKGFVVTSRPSPSSSDSNSATSSAATSPAARSGMLPLTTSASSATTGGGSGGSSQDISPYLSSMSGIATSSSRESHAGTSEENPSEMKLSDRAGSISDVVAAAGGETGDEYPTIRQVSARTFADIPREESIYPFGGTSASMDALTSSGRKNRGFIDVPVDNEDVTINASHLLIPRRPASLLTQQILSSPTVPTVSSTHADAQGTFLPHTSTSQPSSSHSTPRATPTQKMTHTAAVGYPASGHRAGNATSLNKRSSLLGGWTHHFSGSSVSEHGEPSLSRDSSKGKERAYDEDYGRLGGVSRRDRRNGSVSGQGKSQERQRIISNGSGESGVNYGNDQDMSDVIETAELNFIRDPNSGRKMINQYLILQEIGRGQHGTVRLGKDLSVFTPEMSRAGTASSSASALVSRQSSSTHVSRHPSAGPSQTALNELSTSPLHEERDRESDASHSQNNSHTSQSLLAQAVLQSQIEEGGSLLDAAGLAHGDGSFWAIKIVDRYARKKLPGVHAVREGYPVGGPARGVGSTGEKIKREIAILKKCRHPNVVRLREVIDAPASKKIYLILEYCKGGELKWKTPGGEPDLTLNETRKIFRDVVCGLQYLHHQGIIHRDIKPANLLFGEGDVVKISDFGVSHYSHVLRGTSDLEEGESPEDDDPAFMDDHELAKTAGSPAFFAPELCYNGDMTPLSSVTPGREKGEFQYSSLNAAVARARTESVTLGDDTMRALNPAGDARRKRPPITEAIDVWALGVTLYCLLFGKVPFEAPSEYALFSVIPVDDYEIPPYLGADKLPTGGRHAYKAGKSSGVADEVREVLDILEKLLEKDPTKRIKLPEVKKHPFTLRGLSDQSAWLARTDPAMDTYVTVSTDEVAAAVTVGGSFRDKFRKGIKQITQKLQVFAGGNRSGGRSRSGSFVNTPIDERSQGDYSSLVSSVTGSQVNSPGQKYAQRGSSRGSPRNVSGGSETSAVRSPSPKRPGLGRRFSLLGGSQGKRAESPAPSGHHMQFHSPSALTLHLPDHGDRLGRSISDRSTTSSSGFGPFRMGDRRQSTHLAPPMSIMGSSVSSSREVFPRALASSTSAEELNKIIARHIVQPRGSVSGRNASGLNLRRRQSSDIDGAGRQRTLSNASSKGGNLHKIARYLSRGLSQKSSSAGSYVSSGYSAPRDQMSPRSDDMEASSQSGQGSPALTNAAFRSVSRGDPVRKSMDTMSSTSDMALHSPNVHQSARFSPPDLPAWDTHVANGLSPDRAPDNDHMGTQESYDLENGVDLSDDDEEDYGEVRQFTRPLNSSGDLSDGVWRLDSSGWRGEGLPPPQGLGLVTDLARFVDADEGADGNASPSTIVQSSTVLSEDVQTPHAPVSATSTQRVAPISPTSPTRGAVTSFAEHRRRSMSRGSMRGSPLRSALPDRSGSPFGLSDKLGSPMRFPESFHEDEDEDEEGDEGLAIDVGFKRGRRGSKPMTPIAGAIAPVS